MAEDRPWRDSLAAKARAGHEQHHTPEVHLRRYFEIIDSIRAAKTPAAR
jgi:hypothetical protein